MKAVHRAVATAGVACLLVAPRAFSATCTVGTTHWYDTRSAACNGAGRTGGCETARSYMMNRWRYGANEYLVVSNFTSLDIYRLDENGNPTPVLRPAPFQPWGQVEPLGGADRLQWDAAMLDDFPYGIAMLPNFGWVAFEVMNPEAPTGYAVRNSYRREEDPQGVPRYAALFRAGGHVYAVGPFLYPASDAFVVTTFDDPASMTLVSATNLTAGYRVEAAELAGHPYLFAQDPDNPFLGIDVLDLGDPTDPRLVGTIHTDEAIADWEIDVATGQLVVLEGRSSASPPRIRRYAVLNPAAITELPSITLENQDYVMVAGAGDLVVAAQRASGGTSIQPPPFMQAFSVADPSSPLEVVRGRLEIGGSGAAQDEIGQVDGMLVVRTAAGDYNVLRAAYAVGTATRISASCVSGTLPPVAFRVSGGESTASCAAVATSPSRDVAAKGFPGSAFTVLNQSVGFQTATIEISHAAPGGPTVLLPRTLLTGPTVPLPITPADGPGEYQVTVRAFDGPEGRGNELGVMTRSVWLCGDPKAALAVEVAGVTCGATCSGLVGDQIALDAAATEGRPTGYAFVTRTATGASTTTTSVPSHSLPLPSTNDATPGVAVHYAFAAAADDAACGAPMFASLRLDANGRYDSCRVGPTIASGEITAAIAAIQDGIVVPDGGVMRADVEISFAWTGRVAAGRTPRLAWSIEPGNWTATGTDATIPGGLPYGRYTVRLVASTSSDSATATFSFAVPEPSFHFTASETQVTAGQAVTLTLTSVPAGDLAAIRFDVGAGTCDGGDVVIACAAGSCTAGESVTFAYAESARGGSPVITAVGLLRIGGTVPATDSPRIDVSPSGGSCPQACAVTVRTLVPATVTLGQTSAFTASATTTQGTITGYDWSWGEGAAAQAGGPSATHTYTTAGSKAVTVTAYSTCGGSGSKTFTVQVAAASGGMTVSFSPELPLPGEVVTFTFAPRLSRPGDSLSISFGDGGAASLRPVCGGIFGGGCGLVSTVTHTFARDGAFTFTASGTAEGSAVSVSTRVVVVPNCSIDPPIANFTWSPAVPDFGQPVQFIDISQGAPTAWRWDFGDALPPLIAAGTSQQARPLYAFQREGAFTVGLTVTNCKGTSTRRLKVVVCRQKLVPTVDLDWEPRGELPGAPGQQQPYVGQAVRLVDRSNHEPVDWWWQDLGESLDELRGTPVATASWTTAGDKLIRLQAANCVGWSAPKVATITVYEDVRPVIADFDAPATAHTGEVATFTARTGFDAGDPAAFTWSFDGADVQSGPIATHTPSCRGAIEVRLRAERGSLSASASKIVQVDGKPCGPAAFVVSDAARVQGINGSEWRSDVTLFNPSTAVTQVEIEALPAGRDNVEPARIGPLPVPPRGALLLADVLAQFDDPSLTKAALRVTYDNPDDEPPVIRGRTYTAAPGGGAYGQSMPVVGVGRPSGERVFWITGLRDDGLVAGYRANLSLVNLRGAPAEGISVTAYDAAGAVISRSTSVRLGPLGYAQGPLAVFGVGVAGAGSFALKVELPDGAHVLPCSSLVDNLTGDPTESCGLSAVAGTRFLPAVTHLPAESGAAWRSDVTLTNPYAETRTWRLELTPEQADASGVFRNVTLAPNASLSIGDVVSWLYQDERAATGLLEIRPVEEGLQGAPIVVGRTLSPDGERTYGQGIPSLDEGAGATAAGETPRLLLTGMSSEDVARSSLGLVNLSDADATFEVSFYDEAGRLLNEAGSYRVRLGAGRSQQVPLEANLHGLGSTLAAGTRAVSADARVTEGGPGFAWASIVNPTSGDAVFVPGEAAPDYSQRRPRPRLPTP